MSNGYIYIWKGLFVFVCVYVSPVVSTGLLDFLLLFEHATTFRYLRLIRSLCVFLFIFFAFSSSSPFTFSLSVSLFIHPRASLDACLFRSALHVSATYISLYLHMCLSLLVLVYFSSNLQASWGKENAIKQISKCSIKYVYRLFNNTFWTNAAPVPSSTLPLLIKIRPL